MVAKYVMSLYCHTATKLTSETNFKFCQMKWALEYIWVVTVIRYYNNNVIKSRKHQVQLKIFGASNFKMYEIEGIKYLVHQT